MAPEHSIQRYRRWYAALLRLYPSRYHERFGAPMVQTFNDLLRECAEAGNGVFGCALSMYIDTCGGIVTEHKSAAVTHHRGILRVAAGTACLLLLPLVAMQFTDDVAWTLGDFIVAGVLLFGAGSAYVWVAGKGNGATYRLAVGVAVGTALLLVWSNLAVGIIGNEDNPINLMYFGVLGVGLVGAFLARLHAPGMARTLFAMAVSQAAIAGIALVTGMHEAANNSVAEIVGVNGFFVALFLISAGLFRRAAGERIPAGEGQPSSS